MEGFKMSQSALKVPESLSNNQKSSVRPFGMRDKMGYLLGDFGNDFSFILVSTFLMVFYTDVFGISAAAVGTLFLVARFWDAITDVIWGRFIDSRKTSAMGKFRPWIFRMSLPLVISSALMFVHIPGMSDGFYLAYAYVTYILWGMLYTTVNIPYGSMASVISSDSVDRSSLSGWRTMGGMSANLVISAGAPLIVFVDNELSASRMFMMAVIFSVLAFASYMGCVRLSTERIQQPEKKPGEKLSFAKTVKGLVKNVPLITLLIASLLFLMTMMLVGSINVYLFKDYFGSATALSLFSLVQSGAVFLAMPLLTPLVKRFGKKEVASVGMLLASIGYLLLYLIPNISLPVFIAVNAIGLMGFALFNLIIWAFVTDAIDYQEYLTASREDGTIYAIYSFARKMGQALAGGLTGYALTFVGYNSGAATQTEQVKDGIYTVSTLVPSIVYFVIFLVLVFAYPLNKKRTKQLEFDLTEKRETAK
jgi:glycoside/pentoside/hexuronide:cation symporter, GPH family